MFFFLLFFATRIRSGSIFPFHGTDPDLANWYGSDQIRIQNTDFNQFGIIYWGQKNISSGQAFSNHKIYVVNGENKVLYVPK